MMLPTDDYYYQVAQAAMTTGTRDALLGMIGGGDVAIIGVLWLILKRMGEIRDDLKTMHIDQKSFYKEIGQ